MKQLCDRIEILLENERCKSEVMPRLHKGEYEVKMREEELAARLIDE